MLREAVLAFVLVAAPAPLTAEPSRPMPEAPAAPIPQSADTPYPGTLRILIDATDVGRGIFAVHQTIPVASQGDLILLLPKWLPGHHSPSGEIDKLAGLRFTAGGKALRWRRDPVEVYAYHVEVPAGVSEIEADFQFLSATAANQGPVLTSESMLRLPFIAMTLYPAGHFTRQIPVQASIRIPEGWTAFSALRGTVSGNETRYEETNYEVLADSPVMAGRNARQWALSPQVFLDVVADDPAELLASDAQIDAHKRLVEQALKLFQAQHYDHYDLLLSISPRTVRIGLEHQRSSENGAVPGYFSRWDATPAARNLLPHEFTHSWNGKYRRGADLWTPDFHTPMRDSLLWVYEGQTQFWGYVLQARAGLVSKEDTLQQLAMIAAALDADPARQWRPLADTTNDPILSERRPKGWVSWQRSEDYYNEGLLLWLEVDSILRSESHGKRSLDDFAARFFGMNDGDWGTLVYRFNDVVQALNELQPYDWAGFLNQRLYEPAEHAPLGGLAGNGYRLVFRATPSPVFVQTMAARGLEDQRYSIGFSVNGQGQLQNVLWNSPAFRAGLTIDDRIISVGDDAFNAARLKAAIDAGTRSDEPIRLSVRRGDRYRDVAISYHGGLRYPWLERIGNKEVGLDRLLMPR